MDRKSRYIPDYEDPDFIIDDDLEASLERRIIRELLPPVSPWSVDLGCGYGRLSDILAEKSRNVILVDYSMTGMKRARRKMLDNGTDAHFILADISHLPFRDGSIDTFAMFRVFHHFPDPDMAIREIVRCMRPHGHLVFNYNSSDNLWMLLFWLVRSIRESKRDHNFPFPLISGPLRATYDSDARPIYFETHSTVRGIINQNGLIYSGHGYHSGVLGKVNTNNRFLREMVQDLLIHMADKWISRALFPNNYVICSKTGNAVPPEINSLEELLACPECSAPLSEKPEYIECSNGHRFSVVDGIYDFRNPSRH